MAWVLGFWWRGLQAWGLLLVAGPWGSAPWEHGGHALRGGHTLHGGPVGVYAGDRCGRAVGPGGLWWMVERGGRRPGSSSLG